MYSNQYKYSVLGKDGKSMRPKADSDTCIFYALFPIDDTKSEMSFSSSQSFGEFERPQSAPPKLDSLPVSTFRDAAGAPIEAAGSEPTK